MKKSRSGLKERQKNKGNRRTPLMLQWKYRRARPKKVTVHDLLVAFKVILTYILRFKKNLRCRIKIVFFLSVTPNDSLVRRSISQQKSGVSITIDDPIRTGRQLSPPRGKTSNIIHVCNLVNTRSHCSFHYSL